MKFKRGRRKGFAYGVHYIEKACDRVPCEVHWNCEERIIYFFMFLEDMYERMETKD